MAMSRRSLLTVLTASSGLAAMPFVARAEGDQMPIMTRTERALAKLRQGGETTVAWLSKVLKL
jgi:hypothetical protein